MEPLYVEDVDNYYQDYMGPPPPAFDLAPPPSFGLGPPLGLQCNPWMDPLQCPLIFYIILTIVSLTLTITMAFGTTSNNGTDIAVGRRWGAFIVGFILNLIISFWLGWIIYKLCQSCRTGFAWLVFILALFLPFILLLIIGAIMLAILGVTFA